MRDYIVLTIILGGAPFCLRSPYIGILYWSFIAYFNPHTFAWGMARTFPVASVIGVATLAGFLFSRESKTFPITRETVLLLILWLYFTMTTSVALNPDAAWLQWEKVSKILLMTFVTMAVCKTRNRLEGLMLVIAMSLGLLGIKGGVFGLMTGGEFRVWGPPGGFMSDNNDFALALNMALPIIFYMGTVTPNKRLRLVLYTMAALTVISIILTFSRGGFLGLAVVFVCFAIKNRAKFGRILAMALMLVAAIPFIPETYWERISTIKSYDEDASAMGRINAWWTAYNIANARPFTGGGFETFTRAVFQDYAPNPNDFHDVHSVYFEILGEHGYLALLLYLLLVLLTLMTLWKVRHLVKALLPIRDMRWAANYSHMLEISLYAFLTNGVSLGRAYFDLYYHVLAMAVLLHYVVKMEITSIVASKGAAGVTRSQTPHAAPRQGASFAKETLMFIRHDVNRDGPRL